MQKLRMPSGFAPAGKRLWRSITDEFELENEPHKLQILAEAARVAGLIAELDDAAAEAPLTVKGSQGQPVISPLIAEARAQRALLAQLLARLNFESYTDA